jgi:hypothetical protein
MTKTGSFFFLFDMLSFCFSFLLPFHFFCFFVLFHIYIVSIFRFTEVFSLAYPICLKLKVLVVVIVVLKTI